MRKIKTVLLPPDVKVLELLLFSSLNKSTVLCFTKTVSLITVLRKTQCSPKSGIWIKFKQYQFWSFLSPVFLQSSFVKQGLDFVFFFFLKENGHWVRFQHSDGDSSNLSFLITLYLNCETGMSRAFQGGGAISELVFALEEPFSCSGTFYDNSRPVIGYAASPQNCLSGRS